MRIKHSVLKLPEGRRKANSFEIFLKSLVQKKIVSYYSEKGYIIMGRYGTNKTTLKKILKGM